MKVEKAMHVGVEWRDPDTPVVEIAAAMRDHDVGAIPIGSDDRLVGIVTDRDIVCRGVAAGGDLSALKARDVMTQGVAYCRSEDDLDSAIRIMEARKLRRLPVIDADKRMVGMLSLGDVARAAPLSLSGELAKSVAEHH